MINGKLINTDVVGISAAEWYANHDRRIQAESERVMGRVKVLEQKREQKREKVQKGLMATARKRRQ